MSTPEQQVRDMLERMGFENAQLLTAGDVVELANIIAENTQLKNQLEQAISQLVKIRQGCAVKQAELLDRLVKAERRNKLFRYLVDAWTFSDTPPSESDMKRLADAYAKIIEGGALK